MICTITNSSKQSDHRIISKIGKKGPSPIKPPRSNKETTVNNGNPVYSLFQSTLPSEHWLKQDITPFRKHSVSVDGSDSLFSPNCTKYENNNAGFWRRASLPNNYFFMMSSYSCSACRLPFCFNTDFLQTNCEHSICRGCASPTLSSCPVCRIESQQENILPLASSLDSVTITSSLTTEVPSSSLSNQSRDPTFSLSEIPKRVDSFANISPSSELIYPEEVDEAFYIGDLLSSKSIDNSFATTDHSAKTLCCVKLSNIPWDISQRDVKIFFGDLVNLPCSSKYAQSIHIMMDRATGKTLSHCYVEFTSIQEALKAIQYSNQKTIKGRTISVTLCPADELLGLIFPSWHSGFNGSKANLSFPCNSFSNCFITRDEINSLLVICKNYKLHFSRKCAERPFENIITIVTKFPWEQHDLASSSQKDEIFELLKSSIDALKVHLAKEFIQIDRSLLERMIRAGLLCPGFTDFQKSILLQTADNINCPADKKPNSQEQNEQVKLTSRKAQNTIDEDESRLDNSYVHIMPNIATNYNKDVSSLLNILNQSAPKSVEPNVDVFTKNVFTSLFVNRNTQETNVNSGGYNKLCAVNGSKSSSTSSSSSSGSDSDEDSYCFCEKEEENEEGFLFF